MLMQFLLLICILNALSFRAGTRRLECFMLDGGETQRAGTGYGRWSYEIYIKNDRIATIYMETQL